MPCSEVSNAIAWAKKGDSKHSYPVMVYLTKHFGYGDGYPKHQDTVHYASGEVGLVNSPSPHLKGTLSAAKNSGKPGEMIEDAKLSYDVEIFADGTLRYLMKLSGSAVAGSTPTQVNAACVKNVLLTAIHDQEVVTVGFALEDPVPIIR